jgi:hypothetical protein
LLQKKKDHVQKCFFFRMIFWVFNRLKLVWVENRFIEVCRIYFFKCFQVTKYLKKVFEIKMGLDFPTTWCGWSFTSGWHIIFFYCKWHIVYFLNYFFWKVEMSRARKPNLVDPHAPSIIHFGLGKLSPPKLKHVFFCKGFYGFF